MANVDMLKETSAMSCDAAGSKQSKTSAAQKLGQSFSLCQTRAVVFSHLPDLC